MATERIMCAYCVLFAALSDESALNSPFTWAAVCHGNCSAIRGWQHWYAAKWYATMRKFHIFPGHESVTVHYAIRTTRKPKH